MKILFVNPPVIRSENSTPENDFRIEGAIFKPVYGKTPGMSTLWRLLGLNKGIRYGVRAGSRWPWTMPVPHGGPPYPFIMGYAASYVRSHGFDINLIDSVADEEYSYERFLDMVRKESADIVVIEASTPTIDIDLWIAQKISRFTEVCVAGPHVTSQAEKMKDKYPYITYLLKGEYILSALEMATTLRHGIYESKVVTDLDSIPFPFRDYPAALSYYEPTMPTKRPQLQIYGSKGCPFKCTFCLWPQAMYQGKVSLRKPEKIAEEIRECVEKYGFKSILFDDDSFNVGTKRISRLCDELKKIGLPWTMMGRLDCSPAWLYDKMVESGCLGMRFGIETFDSNVLKNIQKGLEREDFLATLTHITKKHPQLMIHLTMMKNMPGQTDEAHENDMKILKDLGYTSGTANDIYRTYQLGNCAPFPGTKLYNDLEGTIESDKLDDWKLYDGARDTVMTKISGDKL